MQDMIQKNKELTQKMVVESESDGVSDPEDGANLQADDNSTQTGASVGKNPWMAKPSIKKPVVYKKPVALINAEVVAQKDASDIDEPVSKKVVATSKTGDEDVSSSDSDSEENTTGTGYIDKNIDEIFSPLEKETSILKKGKGKSTKQSKAKKSAKPQRKRTTGEPKPHIDSDADASMSDSGDETKDIKRSSILEPTIDNYDGGISSSLIRKRTLDDFQGEWDEDDDHTEIPSTSDRRIAKETDNGSTEEVRVDPKKFLTVETSMRQSHIPNLADDSDGELDPEEQQRMTIAQAFAADDVVEEFSREKGDMEEKQKVKDIDLTLPGWGDWGGVGLKPSRRKRKR